MSRPEGQIPAQLSGGQQQRIALARALATSPRPAAAGRAAVGARRAGAHPPARRDPPPAATAGRDHHHGHARPGRGAVDGRPRGRDEPRRHRAGRHAAATSTNGRPRPSSPISSARSTCWRRSRWAAGGFGSAGMELQCACQRRRLRARATPCRLYLRPEDRRWSTDAHAATAASPVRCSRSNSSAVLHGRVPGRRRSKDRACDAAASRCNQLQRPRHRARATRIAVGAARRTASARSPRRQRPRHEGTLAHPAPVVRHASPATPELCARRPDRARRTARGDGRSWSLFLLAPLADASWCTRCRTRTAASSGFAQFVGLPGRHPALLRRVWNTLWVAAGGGGDHGAAGLRLRLCADAQLHAAVQEHVSG